MTSTSSATSSDLGWELRCPHSVLQPHSAVPAWKTMDPYPVPLTDEKGWQKELPMCRHLPKFARFVNSLTCHCSSASITTAILQMKKWDPVRFSDLPVCGHELESLRLEDRHRQSDSKSVFLCLCYYLCALRNLCFLFYTFMCSNLSHTLF